VNLLDPGSGLEQFGSGISNTDSQCTRGGHWVGTSDILLYCYIGVQIGYFTGFYFN
jgi:hypothetical protein